MSRGRLITFEGGEGCGKSTQSRLLADRLGAVLTREPGGTIFGRALRDVLLDPQQHIVAEAEALLFAADRAQHVAEVIRPALDAGRDVVSDRYLASSLAYQGIARGLGVDRIAEISSWATGDLLPDVVFLLDLPLDDALLRLESERDRMESAGRDFHERVRNGFLELADADPGRWVVLDAGEPVDEIAARVWARVGT